MSFRNWTPEDVARQNNKSLGKSGVKPSDQEADKSNSAPLEIPLHNQIIDHCNQQWPRWKYIHANPSKKSCIQVGAQDFTIFLPPKLWICETCSRVTRDKNDYVDGCCGTGYAPIPIVLCVECKAKNGKLDPDQVIWKKEMEMISHTVHTVWSFDQFLELL